MPGRLPKNSGAMSTVFLAGVNTSFNVLPVLFPTITIFGYICCKNIALAAVLISVLIVSKTLSETTTFLTVFGILPFKTDKSDIELLQRISVVPSGKIPSVLMSMETIVLFAFCDIIHPLFCLGKI